MHTRFTSIINELHCPNEVIKSNKLVRKILGCSTSGSGKERSIAILSQVTPEKLTMKELSWESQDHDCGDTSSESEEGDDQVDTSMFFSDGSSNYDAIFALMEKYDYENDEEVNFLNIQKTSKLTFSRSLILLNVLIDAYHDLINEKDMLDAELDQSENGNFGC
ncbi:hypothetical protein HAX54_048961 [Datura stramonium]|uniref:Uncharacterized protein n=1 Tax=Datura stramonium TaxID=4076 RepID=A0ABS8RQY0_DATST|nr:hypothetical protein [Datura stramonium]